MNEASPQLKLAATGAVEPEAGALALDAVGVEALFQGYREALQLYFRQRIADRAEAEDAVQDVYVRLLQYSGSDGARQPQALVFTVARSVLLDRQRRNRSRQADQHVPLALLELPDPMADQEHTASTRQELALLADAIAGLSPKCRRVFLLSRMHHRTYPEIAAELGLSVQMVAKHVSNALAACRRAVGGRGNATGGRA